ncbi:MAG: hypothetical protein IT380_10535 [Myxococcales bacterium]|nr:hypothetical protein [Myxococcales bacterium]
MKLLALTVSLAAWPALAEDGPMDAALETSAGQALQLKALWKKPTVLFYEDRDSTKLNQHVKDALFEAGAKRGLLDAVDVIAVANVAKYDWFPARSFVLKAVRDVEQEFHVPVYCDFKGQLSAPPWSLPAKTSTVVVLSAAGVPVLTLKGRLSEAEVAQVFAALEAQLAR